MSIKYKRPMPIMHEGDVVEAPDLYLRAVTEAEANKTENERRRGLARVHLLNIESPMDIVKGLYYLATSNANENPRIVYANTPAIAISPGGAVTTIPRAIRWLQGLATTGVTLNNVKDALKSFTISLEIGKKKLEAETTATSTTTPPNEDKKDEDKKDDGKNLKEEKPKTSEPNNGFRGTTRKVLWETNKNNFGNAWRWRNAGRVALSPITVPYAVRGLSGVAGVAVGIGLKSPVDVSSSFNSGYNLIMGSDNTNENNLTPADYKSRQLDLEYEDLNKEYLNRLKAARNESLRRSLSDSANVSEQDTLIITPRTSATEGSAVVDEMRKRLKNDF